MNRPAHSSQFFCSDAPARRGFSLIELMVVIGIIALLVAISMGVGASMVTTGKKHATVGMIEALDQTLDAYIDAKGENPPALIEVHYEDLPRTIQSRVGNDQPAFYPAFDGTTEDGKVLVNSVGLYLYAAQSVSSVQDILAGIDPKFIRQYEPGVDGGQNSGGGFSQGSSIMAQPQLLTAFDAWGNPIRFVHPKFDGIIEKTRRTEGNDGDAIRIDRPQNGFFVNPPSGGREMIIHNVRRNKMTKAERDADPKLVADSDGGVCPGARPYFYSAGPDGDPSTTDDNIYTTVPTYLKPF